MSTMTYKGFVARIEYDERDEIFVGHVLGVRDAISFHGNTVPALRQDFHNAVDHYLEVCKKRGEEPEQAYSGKLMLRVPPELHAAASIAAGAAGESLNQWAVKAIATVLELAGGRTSTATAAAAYDAFAGTRPTRHGRSTARKAATERRKQSLKRSAA